MACEQSQKMKEEEKTVCKRLAAIKKHLTSMLMTITGTLYHMDGNVLEYALKFRDNIDDKERTI